MKQLYQGLFLLALLLFVSNAQAGVVGHLGGVNNDSELHFTITADSNNDANITSGSDSTVQFVTNSEIITTATTTSPLTLTSAYNGKILVAIAGETSDFTLPDCASDQMQFTFVAGDANTLTIDVASGDTIKFRTLDSGDAIDSSGTIGDSITLNCYTTDTWIPTAISDIANWTDGGAN